METWIKLYRKFDEWEWFNISEMVHLFIYLLINANNTDGEWRGIKVKRGQLVTGRKSLHEKTKISEQTLRTCLKRLENTKEITIQPTNQYSIITICKYNDYQPEKLNSNQPTNQQLTSDQPAINQRSTTIKEVKNKKEEEYSFNFYSEETKKAKEFSGQMAKDYVNICNHLCLKNTDGSWRLPQVLKMKNQLSLNDFSKLYTKSGNNLELIISKIDSLQTNVKYHGKYTDLYLTINKWLIK